MTTPPASTSRLRDGFELRCIVKPPPTLGKAPVVNPNVPACLPCPPEDWLVLAEAQTGGNLVINNEVRRVVANTPSLVGT